MTEPTHTLPVVYSKTAAAGQQIQVRLDDDSLVVYLDGRWHASAGMPIPLPHPAQVGSKRITHAIGRVGFTTEEASILQKAVGAARQQRVTRLRQERKTRLRNDPEYAAWQAILEAEENVEQTGDRAYGDNPHYSDTGREHADLADARTRLDTLRNAYLTTFGETGTHWSERTRERKEEESRRENDFRDSFIGRGID